MTGAPNKSSRWRLIRRTSSLLQGNAVPVKEIENLDRDFSAVIEAISKLSRREFASLRMGGHIGGDEHHFV